MNCAHICQKDCLPLHKFSKVFVVVFFCWQRFISEHMQHWWTSKSNTYVNCSFMLCIIQELNKYDVITDWTEACRPFSQWDNGSCKACRYDCISFYLKRLLWDTCKCSELTVQFTFIIQQFPPSESI